MGSVLDLCCLSHLSSNIVSTTSSRILWGWLRPAFSPCMAGREYYYNRRTNETSWEIPRKAARTFSAGSSEIYSSTDRGGSFSAVIYGSKFKKCLGCTGWGRGLVQAWDYCNHCTRCESLLTYTIASFGFEQILDRQSHCLAILSVGRLLWCAIPLNTECSGHVRRSIPLQTKIISAATKFNYSRLFHGYRVQEIVCTRIRNLTHVYFL